MTAIDQRIGRPIDVAGAAQLLRAADNVLLLAHNHPDADTLGSALVLAVALRSTTAAAVTVTFDFPHEVPASLAGLPSVELVVPADQAAADLAKFDLVVSVDAASVDRLGRFAAVFDTPVESLVIDHHASNTFFGRHNLVDPSAEANVVVVDRLLQELGVPLDADLAALLYAGLDTDTGGFRHASPAGHQLAARLVEAGAAPAELLRPITDAHPFGWMAMLSAVLGRAQLAQDAAGGAGLVHTCVTTEDLAGLRQEEADSVINILRTSTEADAAAVVKQAAPELWQVSLRSRGAVRIGDAAVSLGGGGHPHAAGFTWHGDYPSAIAALLRALHAAPLDGDDPDAAAPADH